MLLPTVTVPGGVSGGSQTHEHTGQQVRHQTDPLIRDLRNKKPKIVTQVQ